MKKKEGNAKGEEETLYVFASGKFGADCCKCDKLGCIGFRRGVYATNHVLLSIPFRFV